MKTNSKGFTLIEMLIALVILGIIVQVNMSLFKMNLRTAKQAKVANRVLQLDSNCRHLDGTYYGKASDANTLAIYTDGACNTSMGTLNRLDNSTWFNEQTFSHWIVFKNGQLKVAVLKYNS